MVNTRTTSQGKVPCDYIRIGELGGEQGGEEGGGREGVYVVSTSHKGRCLVTTSELVS